jgi:hypothetical protein
VVPLKGSCRIRFLCGPKLAYSYLFDIQVKANPEHLRI